jgi:hypothetical protein
MALRFFRVNPERLLKNCPAVVLFCQERASCAMPTGFDSQPAVSCTWTVLQCVSGGGTAAHFYLMVHTPRLVTLRR